METDIDPEGGYWRFSDTWERTKVTGPTIVTTPETERVVLEQHTDTGEYRLRSLQTVIENAREER